MTSISLHCCWMILLIQWKNSYRNPLRFVLPNSGRGQWMHATSTIGYDGLLFGMLWLGWQEIDWFNKYFTRYYVHMRRRKLSFFISIYWLNEIVYTLGTVISTACNAVHKDHCTSVLSSFNAIACQWCRRLRVQQFVMSHTVAFWE